VNLANNTTTITSQYATGNYPTISTGDDLTENPEGNANLVLYRFTATSGIISNVEKVVQVIEYTGDALDGYDISKGTVEQRFKALGFKQGSTGTKGIDFTSTAQNYFDLTKSYIIAKRQGNYVIIQMSLTFKDLSSANRFYASGTDAFQLASFSEDAYSYDNTKTYAEIFGSKLRVFFSFSNDFNGTMYDPLGNNVYGYWNSGRSGYIDANGIYFNAQFEDKTPRYIQSISYHGKPISIGYEANPL
jgi:hypothetical protein